MPLVATLYLGIWWFGLSFKQARSIVMGKKTGKYRRRKTKKAKQRQQRTRKHSRSSHALSTLNAIGLGRSTPALTELGHWSLLECLISQSWQDTTQLCQVAVARQSPATGEVVVSGFLVDLACLGVKNALTKLYPSPAVYRREYRQHLLASQQMMACDLDLAAKVIEEGTIYARSLGFNPHSDTAMALKILGDAQPENCAETIPLGKDGKPLFVNGPHDDVERIIRILNRKVGQGNYEMLIFLQDPTEGLSEEVL
jgi:hypothetical protein